MSNTWSEEQRIIDGMRTTIDLAEKNTRDDLDKALEKSREVIADAMAIRTRICEMIAALRGSTRPASYHLICKDCGKKVGKSKKEFDKWELRLKDKKIYLCRECRRKPVHPKLMQVTIPDEALKDYQASVKKLKDKDNDVMKTTVRAVPTVQILQGRF